MPVISNPDYVLYKTPSGKDSLLVMSFDYEDGDGDLGYEEGDTSYPFGIGDPLFYNLHNLFYGIENGNQVQYIDNFSGNTIHFSQRLTTITPEGKFKAIKGRMEVRIDFSLLLLNGYDPGKIQLEMWISDRGQHLSNKLVSPEIEIDIQ